MLENHDIELLYAGTHIRIGRSKKNGNIYFQKIDEPTNLMWFRFEKEYYDDYKYYLRDFDKYEQSVVDGTANIFENKIYPDLSYYTVLNKETLDYYIDTFRPISVFVNNECIFDESEDVSYTMKDYCSDMTDLAKNNYFPFIEEIKLNVVHNHNYTISFKTCIKRKGV